MNTSDEQECEANVFAMCLLMPEKLVRQWLKDNPPMDFSEDDTLKKISKDFAVSMKLERTQKVMCNCGLRKLLSEKEHA